MRTMNKMAISSLAFVCVLLTTMFSISGCRTAVAKTSAAPVGPPSGGAGSGLPTPSKPGIVYNGNGHSYEVVNQTMSWTDARRSCEERGGYLATVTDSGEQAFIESLLAQEGNKNCYWLGGYCDGDRRFQWLTGENFGYTKWSPSQPDNSSFHGGEDKIEIWRVGDPNNSTVKANFWNDTDDNVISNSVYPNFDRQRGFICEWN